MIQLSYYNISVRQFLKNVNTYNLKSIMNKYTRRNFYETENRNKTDN